ncbi:MFS transporter [Tsukamurella sp. 8F]|uniref:CynX/NimT family MFS transporter n=1 Tax=unclassified Tsukamurella TaxID=2633480 RepID=UPI0023B97B6F|nr:MULTISPECIES: MFS transporter [unclassified Tsukamurella]MDF0530695.1 MFS transporter [Tsukamurella sp. 8J]MDF0587896.1 MFS transporter [Tsukamurella sp. 8F]
MTAILDRRRGLGSRSTRYGRILVALAILVFALSLRTAVTALTPLLTAIGADLGFGSAVMGVFGMLPTAMFAVAGLATPWFTARFGLERVTLAAVAFTAIGIALRSVTSGTAGLLALSCVALLGMGIGNVVLPPLVKRYFADGVAAMSTAYLLCVQLGTTIPPLTAVPLADAYGWRMSLAVWAIIPIAALLPWVGVVLARRGHDVHDHTGEAAGESTGTVWRSPVAWGMAAMFGMTSLMTYSMFTWIPAVLASAGGSASLGGNMVALFSGVGFVATFVAPAAATRIRNPFPVALACAAVLLIGFAGLLWAPMTATWLWITLIGLGPTTFPMALTLINQRTRTGAGSAALSGFAQGVGYTAACAGPLLFGILHSATGGWSVPFGFLVGTTVVMLVGAFHACRPRMLEDTWGRAGAVAR